MLTFLVLYIGAFSACVPSAALMVVTGLARRGDEAHERDDAEPSRRRG